MIEKLTNMELKKKLLETRNITLAQVLEKARASEAAGQQVKFMAGGADINAIGKRRKGRKSRRQIVLQLWKKGTCCK